MVFLDFFMKKEHYIDMKKTGSDLLNVINSPYKEGFETIVKSDVVPKGLNEDIIRLISQKKNEPDWLLEYRLKAYRHWLTMTEPHWFKGQYAPIDYQDIYYYSAPHKQAPKSLDEVDPEILKTYEKLFSYKISAVKKYD